MFCSRCVIIATGSFKMSCLECILSSYQLFKSAVQTLSLLLLQSVCQADYLPFNVKLNTHTTQTLVSRLFCNAKRLL